MLKAPRSVHSWVSWSWFGNALAGYSVPVLTFFAAKRNALAGAQISVPELTSGAWNLDTFAAAAAVFVEDFTRGAASCDVGCVAFAFAGV